MYKRLSHTLQGNKAKRAPKYVIFFDTETKETKVDENTKDLHLRLGHAVYTVRTGEEGFKVQEACTFRTKGTFTSWVSSVGQRQARTYVVAHNIGFDIRITGLTKYLTKDGWKRTALIMEGLNLMIRYKKGKHTLFLMNNQQLFNSSLADLGESIGVPKLHVDFDTVGDDELLTYCKRDVEVMRQAWNLWYAYIQTNDLGNFQNTIGSQAMSAFRHRFMEHDIVIHTNKQATELERDSYHGGRVECFHIGPYTKGTVYNLDINSMYPFIMSTQPVPTKLLKYYESISIGDFEELRTRFGYIADVTLDIKKPVLPVVHEGRLIFPVGRVSGAFTKPELEPALKESSVLEVRRCSAYREEVVFLQFVKFFYASRLAFKEEGNSQFAYFSKLLLNSLYGKFGQRISEYSAIGFNASLPDGSGTTLDLRKGKEVKYRRLDGITEIETGTREAYNAFPAIASYITGAARAYLARLFELAGWDNVLYCDTDSVFVNEEGYRRVVNEIDAKELGKLKVEGESQDVTILGPKRYRFGNRERSKGIRKDAFVVGENLYLQEQFQSFAGSIRSGLTDRVRIHTITKRLSDLYTKGNVGPDGTVTPFQLPVETVPPVS